MTMTRGGRLGLLGAFYCVGALLWTLLNYFIVDFTITLNAVSAVMAAFIVFFVFTRFPAAKPSENVSMRKTAGLLRYPALILFAVILFFESGFEGAQGKDAPGDPRILPLLGDLIQSIALGNRTQI